MFTPMTAPYGQVQGFAVFFDWVLGIRHQPNQAFGDLSSLPRSIWFNSELVSTEIIVSVLDCLPRNHSLVIFIGDEDRTIPRGIDRRYGGHISMEDWTSLQRDPRIVHLFVTNLDVPPNFKVTAIPVGINPQEGIPLIQDRKSLIVQNKTIITRPLSIAFTNRVREGIGTWAERNTVQRLCQNEWKSFCNVSQPPIRTFESFIKSYSFLFCIHGGGLDPNPNAWTALLNGVIPIMRHFPSDTIYSDLPVLFLGPPKNETTETGQFPWSAEMLSPEFLAKKREELAPWFFNVTLRERVVEKLMMRFWWAKVQFFVDQIDQGNHRA